MACSTVTAHRIRDGADALAQSLAYADACPPLRIVHPRFGHLSMMQARSALGDSEAD